MAKRTEQIERVRQDIVRGAREIFVKKGFSGASISQIAQVAGVSQGLIYHYFQDKIDLWKAVKKDALLAANIDVSFGAREAKSFKSFLEIVVKERFKFYSKNPDLLAILGWEKLQSQGKELFGVSGQFEGVWQKELREFQLSGEISLDIDLQLLAMLILSAIAGVFDYIPKLFDDEQKIQKQEEYLSMIADGLYKAFDHSL